MSLRFRVLVVDDEPIAREGLVRLLRHDPELELLTPSEDGERAVNAILEQRPDLVLLDVQMPVLDGFGVVRTVGAADMPAVIFVTAYDEYAIRAFDVAAVDYVLKPIDDSRLHEALRRGKDHVRRKAVGDVDRLNQVLRAQDDSPTPSRYAQRLAIRESGRIIFIAVSDIDWIEGADYYSRLHVGARTWLIRESMTTLEHRLDPSRFFRTHRSSIVQLDRVRELKWSTAGEGSVILQSGARTRLARGRRDALAGILEGRTSR